MSHHWFPSLAEAKAKAADEAKLDVADRHFQSLLARAVPWGQQCAGEIAVALMQEDISTARARFAEGLALMDELTDAYRTMAEAQRAVHATRERIGLVTVARA